MLVGEMEGVGGASPLPGVPLPLSAPLPAWGGVVMDGPTPLAPTRLTSPLWSLTLSAARRHPQPRRGAP